MVSLAVTSRVEGPEEVLPETRKLQNISLITPLRFVMPGEGGVVGGSGSGSSSSSSSSTSSSSSSTKNNDNNSD